MTETYEAVLGQAVLPAAAWDLTSFLTNAKQQLELWGGLLLMLLGVVGLIWGAIQLVKKLMASPQTEGQQASWGKIGLLGLFGGALLTGGFNLVSRMSSGGQQTLEDLGGGVVIVTQTVTGLLTGVSVLLG